MKPERKGINKKDVFVILILIAMVIGVILVFFNSSNKPTELSYNDLMTHIEEKNVKSITATPVGSGGNGKLYELKGNEEIIMTYFLLNQHLAWNSLFPRKV